MVHPRGEKGSLFILPSSANGYVYRNDLLTTLTGRPASKKMKLSNSNKGWGKMEALLRINQWSYPWTIEREMQARGILLYFLFLLLSLFLGRRVTQVADFPKNMNKTHFGERKTARLTTDATKREKIALRYWTTKTKKSRNLSGASFNPSALRSCIMKGRKFSRFGCPSARR